MCILPMCNMYCGKLVLCCTDLGRDLCNDGDVYGDDGDGVCNCDGE